MLAVTTGLFTVSLVSLTILKAMLGQTTHTVVDHQTFIQVLYWLLNYPTPTLGEAAQEDQMGMKMNLPFWKVNATTNIS